MLRHPGGFNRFALSGFCIACTTTFPLQPLNATELPTARSPADIRFSADVGDTAATLDDTLAVAGGVIRYFFESDNFALPKRKLLAWMQHSAFAVSHYYGRFPVDQLYVAFIPVEGRGVKFGRAFGSRPAAINIFFGRNTKEEDLKSDWILVHEMVHLAFPAVARKHHWVEEGLATYIESIARTNIGDLTAESVWRGFLRGMPHGLPKPGDKGLDHTPTWGRTYWGGALFCLLADIEIRKRTQNRFSLRDALRALVNAGTTIERRMPITEIFKLADDATGVAVLTNLYDKMKAKSVEIDLDDLWQRLGVEVRGESVIFDEQAPLATIRHQITARSVTLAPPR